MKQVKPLLLTAFIALMAFSAIFYSSCRRDRCAGVVCTNGGGCIDGRCLCPAGYTGPNCDELAITNIAYHNNTYTPVTITIGGTSSVILPGSYVTYSGTYGDLAAGTATTYGPAAQSLQLYWDFNDYFPAEPYKDVDINVSPDYFFLEIENISSFYISKVYVNYGLSSQTLDYFSVPNDGAIHGLGYYDAWSNSNLYLTGGGSAWTANYLNLPFTSNQVFTFVAGD